MLAREYGWLPYESDEIDWSDIVGYVSAINERRLRAASEKMREYAMWVNIIHPADPGKLYSRLIALAAPEPGEVDGEVGDMPKLRRLKYSRRKVRTNGGGG